MGRRTGYQYESVLNNGDVSRTTKRTDLTNQLSNWNAGNISMNAGRDITLQGVNLNGANVSLAAGRNLSAIEVYDIKETVDINSSVSMFRQRVSIDINSERTAIGNSIGNGTGVITRTAGNNILDRGTTIAGIAQSTIAGNRVSEEAIKSTIHQERTRTKGGAFWASTQSQGSTQETLQMTNIFVPSNASRFQGGGGVSLQLPKGSDLRAQIDRLKGQPGNEYLGQLAERSDIDWQEVEVINKTWNYKKETMGPATAIIVAIGVSLLTGGMASSLGTTVSGGLGLTGTVAGKVVAASVSAGFSSLASMTATAVINNGGDLGAALEELGSSANVKSLLISMATAGAIQGITENIPVDLLNDKGVLAPSSLSEATVKNATFAQLLGKNMVSAIASATISSAVNGGSLEDSLKASLISAFIDTAAANGANWIGDVTQDGKLSQTLAENFANKLMHGVLGCAIGAAKANSEAGCASGAIGGVVGHLTAEAVKDLGFKDSEVLALGQITSVLAATLAQKDLNIANSTAQNAIANNFLLHKEADAFENEIEKCAKNDGECEKKVIEKYRKISAENIKKYEDCVIEGNTTCINNFKKEAAKSQEFDTIDLDANSLNYFVQKANQVQNGTVLTSGLFSKLGSDLQQAENFAKLRANICAKGSISATDCTNFLKDLKNVQNEQDAKLLLGGLLAATGGPLAANILLSIGKVTIAEAATIAREGLLTFCLRSQFQCLSYADLIAGTLAGANSPSVLPMLETAAVKTVSKLEKVVSQVVAEEIEALKRITSNSNGPVLVGKIPVQVVAQQEKNLLAFEKNNVTQGPKGAKSHLIEDVFTQKKGINGTHNEELFLEKLDEIGGKIVSKKTYPDGITHYEYTYPSTDSKGNILLNEKGETIYKAAKDKTVYNPTILSDDEIYLRGVAAAKAGYNAAIQQGLREYKSRYRGMEFQIFIDQTTNKIKNFYPTKK